MEEVPLNCTPLQQRVVVGNCTESEVPPGRDVKKIEKIHKVCTDVHRASACVHEHNAPQTEAKCIPFHRSRALDDSRGADGHS